MTALIARVPTTCLFLALAASSAWAQSRLAVQLRNQTTICDVPTWTREGPDLRVEVATDGSTLLIPRDSIAAAWIVPAAQRRNAPRAAAIGGLIGAVAPLAIALVAPTGRSDGNGRNMNVFLGTVVSPFTALIGAFTGYVLGANVSSPWLRDESLAPAGSPENERAVLTRAQDICR